MKKKTKKDRPVQEQKKMTKGERRVTFYIGPLDIHGGITGQTYGILFSSPFCVLCVPKQTEMEIKNSPKDNTRLALSLSGRLF